MKILHIMYMSKAISVTRFSISKFLRLNTCSYFSVLQKRWQTSEAVKVPMPDDSKEYPQHIKNIVSEISKLSLIEVADLNELLKKTLNIPDAPVMAFGPGMMGAATQEKDEEEEAKPVKNTFTVKLTGFDESKKIALIKLVKTLIEGLNLVQAKRFVENLPAVVKADILKEEADKLKDTLTEVGAVCSVE